MSGIFHTLVDFLIRKPHVVRPERDILIDRFFKQLILRILEHQPDLKANGRRVIVFGIDVFAIQKYGPGGRL